MENTNPSNATGEAVRELESPPPPGLAFRVGVVGHRPNRLKQADLNKLAIEIKAVLSAIKDEVESVKQESGKLFDNSPLLLRAISPLAEGTDRIFAREALGLGFELCCVMPFQQTEFEKDFAPPQALESDSMTHFRELLGRAKTRFELDGSRADEPNSYGRGGQVVLNQSDVLVVVWDGEFQNKKGGTEETFGSARREGVPVVWIDAHSPHHWQLLPASSGDPRPVTGSRASPNVTADAQNLRASVRAALEVPKLRSSESSEHHHSSDEMPAECGLGIFYEERRPCRTIAVVWKAFRDMVGDSKRPAVSLSPPPFEASVEDEWPRDESSAIAKLVDLLRPFYAWPDKLAVLYADRYRSAFISAFLLSAFAVGMALLPVGLGWHGHEYHSRETVFIAAEFGAIVTILWLISHGLKGKWHERWLEYRLAAELVRHLRLVAPLGGARPLPQLPAHWATYGQPAVSWMAWYVRAIERRIGLPPARVDQQHLLACLDHLVTFLTGQVDYHKKNRERCDRIHERLHLWGMCLLWLTIGCCVFHIILPVPWLTFCSGFFPALGAAMAGIFTQGEFRRIARRSAAMREQLHLLKLKAETLRDHVKNAPPGGPIQLSTEVATLANDSARLLINEVLDWRVIFLDQPLRPPA